MSSPRKITKADFTGVEGPGWPTEPDGSFTIPAGRENWFRFCQVATREQLAQALEALEAAGHRETH